ncbi:MAG: hypothetical protein WD206_07440 [Actinomycetota bacterium]
MGLKSLRVLLTFFLLAGIVLALPAAPAVAEPVPHPSIVSPDPDDGTPHVLDGRINDMAQIGDRVVVAGKFTQTRDSGSPTIQSRTNAASFLASTGKLTSFAPVLDRQVNAVVAHPDGQHVYLGGEFNTIDGIKRRKVVKIDLATGNVVTAFKAAADGKVMDLAIANDRLYIAGQFKKINSIPREGFAAVDLNTGAVDANVAVPFTVPANGVRMVRKIEVTPDGSRLFAIGNFTIVGGLDRYQIAAIDLTTFPATVANWQTNGYKFQCYDDFDSYVRDLDIAPDGSWLVVTTTGGYGGGPPSLCDTIARWETGSVGTDLQPTWVSFTGGDSTYSAAITGEVVYVGGHQRWQNNMYRADAEGPFAVPREGLAALSSQNGIPFRWNPGRQRGVGVFSLVSTAAGLWVGSDTDMLAGEFHARIGFFPLQGGAIVPANRPYRLPNDLVNISAVSGGGNGQLIRRSYDGTTMGTRTTLSVPSMANARGAFALNGKVYTGWSDGRLYVRSFNGSTFGAAQLVPIAGVDTTPGTRFKIPGTTTTIPKFSDHLKLMTGMFYDAGRLYYTISGDSRLYARHFNPESDIVGAELFVASTTADGVAWNNVRGVTLANGNLYYALTDGKLYRVAWNGSKPTGSSVQVGGSGTPDNYDWTSRGIFAFAQAVDTNAPTVPGTPGGTSTRIGEVDLQWAASDDTVSDSLTYRIYRDGDPVAVGEVDSSSKSTVTFTDTTAVAGAMHTYTVDARDATDNASAKSPASDPITVEAPDSVPPSIPGTPSGTSTRIGEVDLEWGASDDETSDDLTYRVYRDAEPTPVGEVSSSSTTTVTFTDTTAVPGATHTYTVDARDELDNASAESPASAPIQVLAPDTTPPTVPGIPNATALSKTKIDLWWAGSSDDHSAQITYRVFRDGDPTPVGEITSADGLVNFTDTGLEPASTHTYTVDATDEADNTSAPSDPSEPVATLGIVFSDDFSTEDFSKWTNSVRMSIDATDGSPSAPSAKMETVSESANAFVTLPDALATACVSARVNVQSTGGSALDLLRLRGPGNTQLVKSYVSAAGVLFIRSDFAATQKNSSTSLPAGWNEIELCGSPGPTSTWDLYLNGSKVVDAWQADTGTLGVGRVQIGDTLSKTVTAGWDDVIVDTVPE